MSNEKVYKPAFEAPPPQRHSVDVLFECIDLQNQKSNDYQNQKSTVKQADYYPSGFRTILDIMHAKMLRMRSMVEAMEHDPIYKPSFEGLEDSCKDLINYASFGVSYLRYRMDGQLSERDVFNRPQTNADWLEQQSLNKGAPTVTNNVPATTWAYIRNPDEVATPTSEYETYEQVFPNDHQQERGEWETNRYGPIYLAETPHYPYPKGRVVNPGAQPPYYDHEAYC